MPKKPKLNLLDKIYIPLILMLFGWAGSQLMEVERLEEKVRHLEQKSSENRDSTQALIGLHLRE